MKRYYLYLYRQNLQRYRLPALLIGVLLLILGILTWFHWISWPQPPFERWLLFASSIALLYWLFTLLAPILAYVQPRHDRIRLQTPFYRLDISYRRIRNTRPVDIAIAFPSETMPRRFRRTIRQLHGMTALGLDLRSWPLPRWLLVVLLGRMMLAPDQPGLILITRDWIELSNQVETMMAAWLDAQRQHPHHPGTNIREILHGDDVNA